MTIGSVGHGDKGTNLGYYGSYIYWLLEVPFVAWMAIVVMRQFAEKPFCAECQNWKVRRELGRFEHDPGEAVVAVSQGEIVRLAASAFHPKDGPLVLRGMPVRTAAPNRPWWWSWPPSWWTTRETSSGRTW